MPIYTAAQSKEAAKTRKRDAHGHFISSKREISPLIKEDTKQKVPQNSPLKKLLNWLNQSGCHQR